MCPAAILGDRASGKTTFLGALYATQVRYGTGTDDDFRFFAPPDSLRLMSRIYETMSSGSFPSATLKDEMSRVEFKFGYRTLVGKIARNSESRLLKPWKGIDFGAYDVSGEDVQEYIDSGVASSPIIKQLLLSHVVVILVDCSKMTLDNQAPAYKQMLHYDSEVAKLVSNFATYKLQEHQDRKVGRGDGGPPTIFPAIVLTKSDMIQAETLHQLGLPPSPPADHNTKERRAFCEGLLRVFLPQTLSQLRGSKVAGISFDNAEYFTSWIRTVTADGGMATVGRPTISIKPAQAGQAAQIDFSYNEFVAFIEYFRSIASRLPDTEASDAESLTGN
jgi:hypothetical protein